MGLFEHFPYSNFHELNLDILVKKMKELEKMVDQLRKSFAAPSVVSVAAEMTDINKIYIYVGSEPGYQTNHWYYYSTATNTWTDGGAYGALDLDTSLDADSHNAVENSVITTALAGKQDSISFPLDVASGGTGASSAATARSNLEVGCVAIDSGIIAGNEYVEYGAKKYSAFIVEGRPGVGFGDINTTIIPAAAITDTNRRYEITDDANYIDFTVRWSGDDLIIGGLQSSQADKSIALYGII